MRKSDYPTVIRRGVAGLVILLLLLLLLGAFAPAAMAQVWPRCNDGCEANDFSVTDAWIVADPNCTPGQDTTAKLWVNFWSNRQHTYCIVSVVDVWAGTDKIYDDLTNDSVGTITGKGNFPRMLSEITWTCGEELKLDNIYVQWMVHSSNPCPGECGNNYPTGQCWMGGPIYVRAPLIANFTFDNVCFCTYTQFTDKTTGGVKPYSYSWDFDNDGTYEIENDPTAANPSYHYDNPGTYTVKLKVTDSDSPANSDSQSYDDVEVYENPTADAGPDKSISAGGLVVIGGSPTASGGATTLHL